MQCITVTFYIATSGHFPSSHQSNVPLLMVLILWHLHYIQAATVRPVGPNYFSSLLCERMTAVILHFKWLIVQHAPFHFCHMYRIRHFGYRVSSEPAFFCRATWPVDWGCHGLLQLGNENRNSLCLRNTFAMTPCGLVGDWQYLVGTSRLFFAFLNVYLVNIETYGTVNSLPLLYPARSRWGTYSGCCSRREGARTSS